MELLRRESPGWLTPALSSFVKVRHILLVVLGVLWANTVSVAQEREVAPRKVALVVGISGFVNDGLRELPYSYKSALRMAKGLYDSGWRVRVLTSWPDKVGFPETRDEKARQIQTWLGKATSWDQSAKFAEVKLALAASLSGLGDGDSFLFYFVGPVVSDSLLLEDSDRSLTNTMPLDALADTMKNSAVRDRVIILDDCRELTDGKSVPIFDGEKPLEMKAATLREKISKPNTRAEVIYSCQPGTTSYVHSEARQLRLHPDPQEPFGNGGSLFTATLLDSIWGQPRTFHGLMEAQTKIRLLSKQKAEQLTGLPEPFSQEDVDLTDESIEFLGPEVKLRPPPPTEDDDYDFYRFSVDRIQLPHDVQDPKQTLSFTLMIDGQMTAFKALRFEESNSEDKDRIRVNWRAYVKVKKGTTKVVQVRLYSADDAFRGGSRVDYIIEDIDLASISGKPWQKTYRTDIVSGYWIVPELKVEKLKGPPTPLSKRTKVDSAYK